MMERPWLSSYDDGVPKQFEYPLKTLPELLRQIADRFPDSPAIHYFGFKMTYRELDEDADRFANLLIQGGSSQGKGWRFTCPIVPRRSSPITAP